MLIITQEYNIQYNKVFSTWNKIKKNSSILSSTYRVCASKMNSFSVLSTGNKIKITSSQPC